MNRLIYLPLLIAIFLVACGSNNNDWDDDDEVQTSQIPQELPETAAERGELWYTVYGCSACHSIDNESDNDRGPSFENLYLKEGQFEDGTTYIADEAYILNAIYNPNEVIVAGYNVNVMPPNFEARFSEQEAELAELGQEVDTAKDLIEFIKTVSP